jgi:ABC-type phosphate transport system auxiliary subunit
MEYVNKLAKQTDDLTRGVYSLQYAGISLIVTDLEASRAEGKDKSVKLAAVEAKLAALGEAKQELERANAALQQQAEALSRKAKEAQPVRGDSGKGQQGRLSSEIPTFTLVHGRPGGQM